MRGKSSGRPLPPEPPGDSSGPPPPPLPSRPAPPTVPNGRPSTDPEPDDYLEPDQLEQSPSPEEDGETYEMPDLPPPPIKGRAAPPPVSPPSSGDEGYDCDGEVYDELEGIAEVKPQAASKPKPPSPEDFEGEGEIYDQCDVQEQNEETGGELYEEAPDMTVLDEGGEIYEVPDEAKVPNQRRVAGSLPTPPPFIKGPPQPPSTNTMPAPLPARSTGQATQKLQTAKKVSGEGPAIMGISMDMLGNKMANLRKVSTGKDPEKSSLQSEDIDPDNVSVKDKILLFKQAVETEGSDEDTNSASLHSQITNVRKSLKQNNPLRNATTNNTYFTKEILSATPISDTSKLTIQQRIAMMGGKSLGGANFIESTPKSNQSTPKTDFRSNIKPVQGTKGIKPPTPVKPRQVPQPNRIPNVGSHVQISPGTNRTPPPPVQTQPPPAKITPVLPPPPTEYPEEIYDDALNFLPQDPLRDEVWYHGERERANCERDLTSNGQDGSYLVRKSKQGGNAQPYTLVVLYKGHVYNLRIRRRADDKIALGNEKEAEKELAFDSVSELITYHTSNEVILINNSENKQYKAFLKFPLRET